MAYSKIVFDNDGVNIDSEDLAMRIMDDWGVALIHKYKPAADLPVDHIYRTYPGTSTDKIVEALIQKFDLPQDRIRQDYNLAPDANIAVDLADLITIETISRFKVELKAVPGTTAALTEIHAMFGADNVALATTSRADRMDVSLAHATDPVSGDNARLGELFPQGAQRRSGYGHSNKYDEAFAALGWDAAATIVVEDSRSGVTKAKANRPDTKVIGTVAAKFYEDKNAQAAVLLQDGADIVIAGMSDLPKAAAWIRAGMTPETRPEFDTQIWSPPQRAETVRNHRFDLNC